MTPKSGTFGELFRKYRLRAEFNTLSEVGSALAEKGFIFEDSIFSRWQNNSRLPHSRKILLKLIEIFVERGALTTLVEVNEFLSSANRGYVSDTEREIIHLKSPSDIFQVPNEIRNFSGRQGIVDSVLHMDALPGKVILLYGPAGIGKSALAIRLGHVLRHRFLDGVLWYKIEKDNLMDILLSIGRIVGEDISGIHDLHVRATVVRALLANKQVLLFLDSVEMNDDIHILIPHSNLCTVIMTSQKNMLKSHADYVSIQVPSFSELETLSLFQQVMKKKYRPSYRDTVLQTARRVGNLPLAIHILARHLVHANLPVSRLPELLNENVLFFYNLEYENKSLHAAFEMSYGKLDGTAKAVLVSASIFKGKDFSAQSIGYINGFSALQTAHVLQQLIDLSLVEHSTKHRYRLHPAIQQFVRDKLDSPRSSRLIIIAWGMFIFFVAWWVYLQMFVEKENIQYGIFTTSKAILAIFGGASGIYIARGWGGATSQLGRSVNMFSFGLFFQAFGELAWGYSANIQHISLPYPSWADLGYFTAIPFYIYGAILLAKSSGIKITIQSFRKKLIAIMIPVGMLIIAYMLFLHGYTFDVSNPVKIFLDFGYPFGEAIYISVAIITFIFSRTLLDGIMRSKALLILVALLVQFIADYTFLYTIDTYYQGNYVTLGYLLAFFLMTLALLHLKSIQVHVKDA